MVAFRKYHVGNLLLILSLGLCSSCAQSNLTENELILSRMNVDDCYSDSDVARMVKAAVRGDVELVRSQVTEGVDVNADGLSNVRPLFWPLLKRNIDGFRVLLELGADPNMEAELVGERVYRVSVMEMAAACEDQTYLKLALKHGGNPDALVNAGDRTIIYEAILRSNASNVSLLIEAKADLNWRDKSGGTPLLYASSIKNYDFVYQLLEAEADPLIKDNFGYNLYENIYVFGSRGIKKESHWYRWYLKVLEKLEIDPSVAGTKKPIPQNRAN